MVSGVGVISSVRAIINRLRGLSDADLRELSAAVDAERNHRGHGEDGGESSPSPDQNREVAPVAPTHCGGEWGRADGHLSAMSQCVGWK